MSVFFLPDPLGNPGVRACLGVSDAPPVRAEATGHVLRLDRATLRLALVAGPGEAAAGWLVGARSPAAAAAQAVLAAMGGAEARVEARLVDGSSTLAEARTQDRAAPGEIFTDAAWTPDLEAQLRELIRELLGLPDRADPGRLAATASRAAARVRGSARAVPHRLGSDVGRADVETVSVRRPYAAHFAVEEHRLRHRRFDGTMTGVLDRAVFASGDAVTVLPFDPERGAVLMVEQFRAGPAARLDPRPWSLEPVAGRCDGLEAPEETARREAAEEAGLRLGRLERAGGYYTTPGIAAEFVTSFIGEADLAAAGGVHGLAEEDEDIRALVVPLETALAAAEAGEIANAPLLVSLLWLARHRDRIVAAWTTAAAEHASG